MMTGLYARFENYMRSLNPQPESETLVAGVSGGADSVCLLLLLSAYARENSCRLVCVHVNHGIRGAEADRDEAYVKELCGRLGNVTFEVFHENITEYAKTAGITVEEAGRARRYELFAEVCEKYGSFRLFVAHNMRDRAETVLFNLFRGSSVAGVSGIRDEIALLNNKEITIYRPLLNVDRPEILTYLEENNCHYCTDSTNLANDYTRNRIRNLILPEAEKINAGAVEHICASADDVSEVWDYFSDEADRLAKEHLNPGFLDLSGFKDLKPVMQRELVYRLICEACGRKKDIGRKHVLSGVELALGESGKKLDLPYGVVLRKEYEKLLAGIMPDEAENSKNDDIINEPLAVDLNKDEAEYRAGSFIYVVLIYDNIRDSESTNLDFSDKTRVYFDYDKVLALGTEPEFRTAREGDWFSPFVDGRKKTINRFFIDEKIGAAEREKMLLFAAGDHVLWIPGYRNDEGFRINENTVKIMEVRRKYDG